MKTILAALIFGAFAVQAHAASITNTDAQPHSLVVTEGGVTSDLVVGPGETVSACQSGCFITMPNGDRETLAGSETVEIVGGKAVLK